MKKIFIVLISVIFVTFSSNAPRTNDLQSPIISDICTNLSETEEDNTSTTAIFSESDESRTSSPINPTKYKEDNATPYSQDPTQRAIWLYKTESNILYFCLYPKLNINYFPTYAQDQKFLTEEINGVTTYKKCFVDITEGVTAANKVPLLEYFGVREDSINVVSDIINNCRNNCMMENNGNDCMMENKESNCVYFNIPMQPKEETKVTSQTNIWKHSNIATPIWPQTNKPRK